jgi:hypothetical protein
MPNENFQNENFLNIFGKICFILMILLILKSMFQDIIFRIQYSFPSISTTTSNPIDTSKDPLQQNLIQRQIIKYQGDKDAYGLETFATYSISGMVVAKNTNFWFRDIDKSLFDDVALMDVGLAWGDWANENTIKKNAKFKSSKTLGSARMLETSALPSHTIAFDYMREHSSHTHLIPKDINVMSALLTLHKYENVKLDGYLVDVLLPKGYTAYTSDTRDDTDPTSRGIQILMDENSAGGGGSCEIMYVTQVQIGNNIYR